MRGCLGTRARTQRRPNRRVLDSSGVKALTRPANFDKDDILKGAYVLETDAEPAFVLIASGSEVGVAVDAKQLLAEQGHQARVVSAPCWDAFRRQPAAYQERVLPKGVRRVTLEAGVTTPWAEATGSDGIRIGIDRFGTSGPYQELAGAFGLTPRQVADAILASL